MRSVADTARVWVKTGWPDEPGTAYQYELTMSRVAQVIDPREELDIADVPGEEYAYALYELWGSCKPRTWNRNRATVLSFLTWAKETAKWTNAELPPTCARRKVTDDRTRIVDQEQDLDVLWDPKRFALRERALWRGLYESASRASAFLALDVPDLDFRRRRARARLKGGDVDWLYFEDQAAELLAELVEGRHRGPVFLTNRRPRNWRIRPASDFAPDGRRCRLSYNRAERIFKEATRQLGYDGEELAFPDFEFLTLHQHRKARLTHLAEEGWDTPMLQGLSKHKSARVLHEVYAKPSGAAVERALRRRESTRN